MIGDIPSYSRCDNHDYNRPVNLGYAQSIPIIESQCTADIKCRGQRNPCEVNAEGKFFEPIVLHSMYGFKFDQVLIKHNQTYEHNNNDCDR